MVVPDTKTATLKEFTAQHGQPGGILYSDAAAAYEDFDHVARHESVKHSIGEYVRGMAHVNGMESFLGDDEAGVPRDVSPDEPKAPAAVR